MLPQVAAADTDILVWLDVLLKGKPEQQALARTEIAMILEARGHLDDAEEAYWTNVQARSTDRRAYERLMAIYQQKGDRLSASLVRRQLNEVFNPPAASPDTPAAAGAARQAAPGRTIDPRQRRLRGAADQSQAPLALEPAAPEPPQPPAPPLVTATGPSAAAGYAYAAIVHAAHLQAASQEAARHQDAAQPATDQPPATSPPPSVAFQQPPPARPAADSPYPSVPQTAGPASPASRPTQPTYQPAQLPTHEPAAHQRRRTAPLAPNPGPFPSRERFNPSTLIALQPATIGALLLASIGAAAIIAFLLVAAERGFGGRSNSATPGAPVVPQSVASQLPPRCTDAALRFPALSLSDPRGAVAGGYRENGVDVDLQRPGAARLTLDQAEQVLGGWMAISLLMERSGQAPPTLAGWLDTDTDKPTLANAILASRRVDGMITQDEWAAIRGWPATTCEGAFLHDPRNAQAVRLMERVVAR